MPGRPQLAALNPVILAGEIAHYHTGPEDCQQSEQDISGL